MTEPIIAIVPNAADNNDGKAPAGRPAASRGGRRTPGQPGSHQAPGVQAMLIGENVTAELDGNTLILRVDVTERLRLSGSGKTTIVASTGGFSSAMGGVGVSLNVTAKNR